MPTYLSPGVYVEEVSSGTKPIEGVGTAIAAFIGMAPIGPSDQPLSVGDLSALDIHDADNPLTRISASVSMVETEPVVCACFGVGEDCIRKAVAAGEAGNVTEIGRVTRAGTNCGSCLPELKQIVAQERAKQRLKEPAA